MAAAVSTYAIWFLWAALVSIVGGWIALFAKAVSRGMFGVKRFRTCRSFAKDLLRRGYHDAHIVLTHKPTGRFVRFEKYIRFAGSYGIRLAVPETGWGQEYILRLRAYCEANGFTLSTPAAPSQDQASYTYIDCGMDAGRAWALASAIWTDLFGLSDSTRCKYEGNDILEFDDLVDSPAYPRYSREEAQKHAMRDIERQTGRPLPSCSYALGATTTVVAFMVASVGLPAATLLSIGSPPDWTMHLGSLSASGHSTSLTFWVIYLMSLAALVGFPSRTEKSESERQWVSKILRLFFRFIGAALPIAVVVVWIGA